TSAEPFSAAMCSGDSDRPNLFGSAPAASRSRTLPRSSHVYQVKPVHPPSSIMAASMAFRRTGRVAFPQTSQDSRDAEAKVGHGSGDRLPVRDQFGPLPGEQRGSSAQQDRHEVEPYLLEQARRKQLARDLGAQHHDVLVP